MHRSSITNPVSSKAGPYWLNTSPSLIIQPKPLNTVCQSFQSRSLAVTLISDSEETDSVSPCLKQLEEPRREVKRKKILWKERLRTTQYFMLYPRLLQADENLWLLEIDGVLY